MIWLIWKIICIISICLFLRLEIENFKDDYEYQNACTRYLITDAIVIIWLVANALILIMWV